MSNCKKEKNICTLYILTTIKLFQYELLKAQLKLSPYKTPKKLRNHSRLSHVSDDRVAATQQHFS